MIIGNTLGTSTHLGGRPLSPGYPATVGYGPSYGTNCYGVGGQVVGLGGIGGTTISSSRVGACGVGGGVLGVSGNYGVGNCYGVGGGMIGGGIATSVAPCAATTLPATVSQITTPAVSGGVTVVDAACPARKISK